MKALYFLLIAWQFGYKLLFSAVTAKDTEVVAERAQISLTLYKYMCAAFVVQGILFACALGVLLTGQDEASQLARVIVALIEKGVFIAALSFFFKAPFRTLALAAILVSDALSFVLILVDAPAIVHIAVGILLGISLLRHLIKRP